jgi:hypothetical protein
MPIAPATVQEMQASPVIALPTSTLSGSTEICRGSTASMQLVFTGVPPFEYIYSDGSGTTFGPFTTGGLQYTG